MKKDLIDQPVFRLISPPIYGLMMYLLILLLNNSLGQVGETIFTVELLLCIVLSYLVSEPLRFVIRFFRRSVVENLRDPMSIILLLFFSLLIGASINLLATYSYFRFYEDFEYFSLFKAVLIKIVIVYSISSLLYTLFFLSNHFLSVKNESELKKEDLKRQNLEHQLEIFNNEINPELLFQSLETLITLVHHNQDMAEDYVDRLALVYRYILDNRKKELVVVKDEIQAAKNLIYLFQERFPNQLEFDLKNELEKGDKLMVPNALPTMIDCIVNNSIISSRQPLKLTIDGNGDEDYLIIEYSDNLKLSENKFIKKRCKNVHNAFAFFSDRPVIEIKAYGKGYVKFPLLGLNDRI